MGNPKANVPMRRVDFDGQGSINVTGGSYPAKMWNAVMAKALAARPLEEFPDAPSLDRSGKVIFLENDTCSVGLGLQDGSSFTARLPCSQVDVNGGGGFTPKGSAQCSVNVPNPDGSTRSTTVPCSQVPVRLRHDHDGATDATQHHASRPATDGPRTDDDTAADHPQRATGHDPARHGDDRPTGAMRRAGVAGRASG